MKKSLIITSCLLSSLVTAAEVDQFTRRNENISDSAPIVNQKANEFVKEAIAKLNEKSNCDETELYKELRNYFANHAKGQLTIFALHDSSIERRTMKIQDSIFRDWTVFDGYLLGRPGANKSELALSPLIRMGDVVIGVDKFEHMFGRGFSYFNQHYIKGKTVEKAIKSGVFGEKTIYGGNKLATGVYSYADLSANFNGMRFWNHFLMKEKDVLGDDFGPYLKCTNNKWEQIKEIDFTHYIDDSMDEAINCSKFPTKKTAVKYRQNVERVIRAESLSSENFSCPLDMNKFTTIAEKYKKMKKWIINQSEDRTVSYFNEY